MKERYLKIGTIVALSIATILSLISSFCLIINKQTLHQQHMTDYETFLKNDEDFLCYYYREVENIYSKDKDNAIRNYLLSLNWKETNKYSNKGKAIYLQYTNRYTMTLYEETSFCVVYYGEKNESLDIMGGTRYYNFSNGDFSKIMSLIDESKETTYEK